MRSAALLFSLVLAGPLWAGEIRWSAPVEIAAGPGVRGPWQQNDSRYEYVDDPSVAIDDEGATAFAWVDQGRKDVFFRRFHPDGSPASEPVNVSRNAETFSWLPRVAFAPGDARRVFVLWQEIIFSGGSHGGDILFARSEDGGASFSDPINLSSSVAGDGKGRINRDIWHNGSFDLAASRDGNVYAAWTEYEGALWVARSRDGGASFAPRVRIVERGVARAPSLAIGPDGAIYLAWTVGEDDRADIRLARSTDGTASFGAARVVEDSKGYSDAPKIAVDRAGVLHLAFAESASGPFDRYSVRYARSSDGGASFTPSIQVSNVNAAFPQLALDSVGRVYVLWELFHEHRHRPRGLGFAVSGDSGASFGPPAFIPGSADRPGHWNGSHQGLLMKKLAVSPEGAIAVVNSSLREGVRSRVWLIRGLR